VVIGGAAWQSPKARQASAGASHRRWPLLGPAVLSPRDGVLELVRELNTNYDLYLNDHCLDGKPVLPLAIATALIGEAVAQAWPDLQVAAIRELRLLHGVVLDDGAKKVRVVAKPLGGTAQRPARIAIEITGAGHPHRIHYRANVELVQRLPEPPSFNVTPLADGKAFSMEIADFYERWVFHGPMFQGILRIDQVGPGGVKALIETSSPDRWIAGASQGQWLIDPLMFDSALQLLVLWGREHWDMTALPNGFESYRRFATPSGRRILCEIRLRPTTGRPTIHADIYFVDAATGIMVGVLEDMEGACSKALNRLADRSALAAVANQL
jgi:Polyketide synthase dehydratase N-terminal domain/Polyketide synthase dehydratase domain